MQRLETEYLEKDKGIVWTANNKNLQSVTEMITPPARVVTKRDVRVDDSGGTIRSIPVDSINGVGLDYEQVDLTAFQDAVKGSLPALPSCTITITGPFSTDAAAAAGTLSGSHTVLNNLPGGVTPLSFGVFLGMRHTWEAGEPTFGLSSSATSGFLCKKYDVKDGKYSAEFVVYPGSSVPAWGTAAIT